MSLSGRLLAFFLIGLALVLTGFSTTLFLLARSYLHQQLDVSLKAAINTLAAAAEKEPDGIEWKSHERQIQVGGAFPDSTILWSVHADDGRLLEASEDLRPNDELRRDIAAADPTAGFLADEMLGEDRRCLRRTLSMEGPLAPPESSELRYSKIVLTVAASEKPIRLLLGLLSTALMITSAAIWVIALFTGRWFCRRALRPIIAMAEQAQAMKAEEREERLDVPASGDELEALGQSFNGLLDRLHDALERQRRFTGDASHQLRTPLTALLGQVEVALRHPRTVDDYQRTLTSVQLQAQHLGQIVEMLLYLARANSEAKLENLAPLDLKAWLPEHLRNWSSRPRSRDLQLALTTSERCFVQSQSPLLGQLLDNLLENAFKYSDAGSPVVVRLSIANNQAALSVEDHGMGIDEADLPHLFEPFYRSASARAHGRQGIGLGLSIARRIAELFGGTLTAQGAPGSGSQFMLVMPLITPGPG